MGKTIVMRILLLPLLLACCAFPAIEPAAAAAHKKRLVCPQSWPEDASATLQKATFSRLAENSGPDSFENPTPWSALEGDDVSCLYSNGRQLLITIPGKPDHCYAGDRKHPKPGEPDDIVYCTYTPTGVPAKDAVNPREMEPLTRASTFRGVRLGMTGMEIGDVLQAKPNEPEGGYQQLFLLPDKQQVLVGYVSRQAAMIEFRPPLGKTYGLYKEICERFGFPDKYQLPGSAIWRGADGVRFVLYDGYNFGARGLQDEVAFLLDGKNLVDLDKYIERNGMP